MNRWQRAKKESLYLNVASDGRSDSKAFHPRGIDQIDLNVAKNFTIRAWVNRSERLRGEPFIQ
jgi:hypothetical protein